MSTGHLRPPTHEFASPSSSARSSVSDHSPSQGSSTEALTLNTSHSRQNAFVPPPLPPRPTPAAPAQRKAVPNLPPGASSPDSAPPSRQIAPPLPPRPRPSANNAPPPPTYASENIVADYSHLPPPPSNEKVLPQRPTRRHWYYPANRRLRYWLWGAGLALIVAIAIVIAVCVTVIPKSKSSSSSSTTSTTNTTSVTNFVGHPLSPSEGGATFGAVGTIPTFGDKSADHFVMTTNRSIVVTRIDPIVNPNAPGSHNHRVHGSSYFTANLTSATEMQKLANCTTTVVQDDKSAYWVSQLYYRYPNGSMVGIHVDRTSLYYFMKAPIGTRLYAFPDNYNIVVGDPMRRSVNTSDPNYSAMWYQCYRGAGRDTRNNGFPSTACSDGLVQAVQFPSCWDGVYAEDGNYTSHVAYTTDSPQGYVCPDGFPKKFITLQFETVFATYDYPWNGAGNTWALSNGDTSGYGIHADFMNGWKTDVLQNTLDYCRYMNATKQATAADDPANCPFLNATIDLNISYGCRLQTQIVNEDVGQVKAIEYLPGCNGIWSGNTSKPACPGDHINGGYLELTDPVTWYRNEPYAF